MHWKGKINLKESFKWIPNRTLQVFFSDGILGRISRRIRGRIYGWYSGTILGGIPLEMLFGRFPEQVIRIIIGKILGRVPERILRTSHGTITVRWLKCGSSTSMNTWKMKVKVIGISSQEPFWIWLRVKNNAMMFRFKRIVLFRLRMFKFCVFS